MFHKKQIFKLNVLRQFATDEKSCVSVVSTTRLLALPPFFLNDMKSGILYMLNAMLKKYDRSLGGIVIGYQNIKVLMDENTGIIPIGTSETEVNISVDFYIFQPKIGNYLEGIVNKKSNNHIGCLVHHYFNATILKPEDIEYDDWICRDVSVDDKITFKVKDLDFTTLLPYIEGVVEDNISKKNIKGNVNRNVDKIFTNHVDETSENESLYSKKLSRKDKKFKSEFSDNKKVKNRNEEEVSVLEDSINTSSGEFKSFTSPKKKEKKKKKIDLELDNHNKREEERSSKDKELILDSSNNECNAEENHFKKKKKKKEKEKEKEKNKHDNDDQDLSTVKNSKKEEDPMPSFLEKCVQLENENSDDFMKEEKSKKVKKKKKKEKEKEKEEEKEKEKEKHSLESNKTSMCLPVEEAEDNMFYSTQLETVSEHKKLTMPYFSPILPFDKKIKNEMTSPTLDLSRHLSSEKESQGKEKKKKSKKRKAEEKDESAGEPTPKKMKTSDTPQKMKTSDTPQKMKTSDTPQKMKTSDTPQKMKTSDTPQKMKTSDTPQKMKTSDTSKKKATQVQVNGLQVKSDTQSLMEEMYKKLINEAKEQLNLSDKESSKVKKKKKSKSREKKATTQSELSKNSTTQVNGAEEKSEVQSILDKLLEEEIKRVRENSIASDREKSKSHDKSKADKQEKKASKERSKSSSSKVKKHSKTSLISVNGENKKFDVHHGS